MSDNRTANRIRLAILGASGYTGAELVRLLAHHPDAEIRALTAERKAGSAMAEVFPHLGHLDLPPLVAIEQVDWSALDLVFCALPHGMTQEVVAGLPDHLKVVDLSADFRLFDPAVYAEWYGHPHLAPELQAEAVYGLTEFTRAAIREARLIACPGCYPTAAQLPLVPLLEAGAIEAQDIVIDAKSGVSGAGRALKEGSLFTEVSEALHAYGVGHHRHMPEIEQQISAAAGEPVIVSFTPHLVPMNRGLLATIYVRVRDGATPQALHALLARRFAGEPFVHVLPFGATPATRHVRGSNHALIGVVADRRPGGAILVAAIDNLVKGASGQAVQNMNVLFDLPETSGLTQEPLFP